MAHETIEQALRNGDYSLLEEKLLELEARIEALEEQQKPKTKKGD